MMSVVAKLRGKFIAGLIVTVPLIATVLALRFLLTTLDSLLGPALSALIGREVPGLGLLATLLLVLVAGIVATNYAGRRVLNRMEKVLATVPLVRRIYGASKDIVESATLARRYVLREVVMLEYPRKGVYSYGFVTSYTNRIGLDGPKRLANVFVPGPPVPTTGLLVAVPIEELTYLDLTVEDALKLILSLGIATPRELHQRSAPPIANSGETGV